MSKKMPLSYLILSRVQWVMYGNFFPSSSQYLTNSEVQMPLCSFPVEFLRIKNIHSLNTLNFNKCINYKNISHTLLITSTNMSFCKEICLFINNIVLKLLFFSWLCKKHILLLKIYQNISQHLFYCILVKTNNV